MRHLKPVLVTAATVAGVVGTLVLNPSIREVAPAAAGGAVEEGASSDRTGAATPASTTATGTYTGDAYSTPYGPVQVEAVVADGVLEDIVFVQLPQDHHSQRINDYAAPALVEEALTAQSARVDAVSGATWTAEGFRASLQSALDEAGL